MMTYTRYWLAILWTFIAIFGVMAQDEATEEELPVIPYFQSYSFNVPVLDTWEDQSTDSIAQFHLADADVTIRTNVVFNSDSIDGAQADLADYLGAELPAPTYSEKVNLADGTWAVLVYDIDDETTISAMARVDDGRTYVVSLIESNPDAKIVMATIQHGEEDQDDPTPEIAIAVETFTSADPADLSDPQVITLPSGEWTYQSTDTVEALGWVFGNDSYLAIAEGTIDNLPDIANAYNTTLLGFFVTPDNSAYLALGIVAALGTLAILVISIWWRAKGLQKDLEVIDQLVNDND
jgi:hypothetical protein